MGCGQTKNEHCQARHRFSRCSGLDVPEMFTSLMLVAIDTRKDYGEPRKIGFGFIRGRLMVVAFTEREPNSNRIISARKANTREEAYYQDAIADELGKN